MKDFLELFLLAEHTLFKFFHDFLTEFTLESNLFLKYSVSASNAILVNVLLKFLYLTSSSGCLVNNHSLYNLFLVTLDFLRPLVIQGLSFDRLRDN